MVTLTITYLITQPVGISTPNALDTLWLVFMQIPVFDGPDGDSHHNLPYHTASSDVLTKRYRHSLVGVHTTSCIQRP